MGARRSEYTPDFISEAVKATETRTIREVAGSLGVSYWTLREWRKREMAEPKQSTKTENAKSAKELEAENRKLKKELADLKMDNAILKKYAAMLSREQ